MILATFLATVAIGIPTDAKGPTLDFPGRPTYAVEQPVRGSNVLIGQGASATLFMRTGYFALTSPTMPNEGQLVFVVRIDGQALTLDRKLESQFSGPAVLVDVPVQEGVQLDGVTLDRLDLNLCVGARVRNLTIRAGWGQASPWAIANHYGRDNVFENITIEDPGGDKGPGRAYGLHEQQSVGTIVRNLLAKGVRHPMPIFGGANGLLDGFVVSQPAGASIDLHGRGSLGYTFRNGELGGGDVAVGNTPATGDADVTIERCSGGKTLHVYAGSSVTVRDCVFGGPLMLWATADGCARSVLMERTALKAYSDGNVVRYAGAGTVTTTVTLRDVVLR